MLACTYVCGMCRCVGVCVVSYIKTSTEIATYKKQKSIGLMLLIYGHRERTRKLKFCKEAWFVPGTDMA